MDIQITQILFQILNFSVVLFVLNKFLYKPILNIIEQRQKKVSQGMKAADENIKINQELESNKKKVLADAQKEASKIVAQAKKSAQKDVAALMEKAKADASKVLEKERKSLTASVDQEKKELEKEFALLVKQTTGELVKKYLSSADQKIIISAQAKELKGFTL